jgi:hypothetical protein
MPSKKEADLKKERKGEDDNIVNKLELSDIIFPE